jgi:hypothetical protein
MPSVGAVELRVTVKCIKILIVAHQSFYGKFAGNNKPYAGLQVNTRSCTENKRTFVC